MLLSIVLLLVGLALLVAGGEALVRGASALALRLGVAPVVVGMTVVAFGTSTPELVVNVAASLKGTGEIGFGNIVGSNIANIALLLGITCLIKPVVAHATIVLREIPMMVLTCLVGIVISYDTLLTGHENVWDRGDGLILLLLFCVFLYYTIQDALRQRLSSDLYVEEVSESAKSQAHAMSMGKCVLLVAVGLAVLIVGGKITVDHAVKFAQALGVPEVVIGLTIVAVGTGLPEMATSIIAARNNQSDLALGNIVGSNIYNLLFIGGVSAVIYPMEIPPAGMVDLLVMLVVSIVLLPMVLTHQRTITRGEGAILLIGYVLYVGYLTNMALR